MTHLRGAESFTLRRIASSSVKDSHEKSTAAVTIDRPERNSRQHTQIKSAEGDLATAAAAPIAGYVGGRLLTQRSPVTDKRRAHSDGHVPSDSFDLSDSDQVEAVVTIQIVKQDLPSAGIAIEDNNIHSHLLEYRARKIHHLPSNRVPLGLGQQWQLVKQFIVSDYYFGELDELAKEHFLQKMLKAFISQQSQKN
ncbi:hypothetical protein DAPPUDRAFT_313923 [Daphnia pulex]|uniref:Uncharacterized protein n=1 Tax=Daphnia pulex TaxID=6669 RepID=E9G5P4_DAPPU|nr:hypothetical protein DAPPUDRAFT_313923 [Daphnia pulex]|eukprot:EFX85241.1 hypothetical protein DAPPUDRAFT_313923 [Daphnia pulex]